MPEIRYYKVTQVREVEVAANHAMDAILIAKGSFDDSTDTPVDPEKVWGYVTSSVTEKSLNTERLR